MMRALYTAASGMLAQQTNVDTISNNLANVSTTGYKTQRTEFKSLLYQTLQTATTTANGENKPISAQVGLGTRVAATTSLFTQGEMLASESDTDFAINGDGVFAVRGTNGETYYTRNGDFTWSVGTEGTILTTNAGNPILDTNGNNIVVPAGVQSASMIFGQDGSISYQNQAGNIVNTGQTVALYQFNNPAGLDKMSDSLLGETAASGAPISEATGTGITRSTIHQNYLEGSNVQVADEMVNMIIAQRAYELNSKAIQASDDMLSQANQLRR